MFNYSDTIDLLDAIDEGMKEEKAIKNLKNLLLDESFMKWIFNPPKVANAVEMANELQIGFTRTKVMKAVSLTMDDVGYNKFDRSVATFLYGIVNLTIAANNDQIKKITAKRKDGEISTREEAKMMEKVEKNNKALKDLFKSIKKVVKKDAKALSRQTGIPKDQCTIALHSVPEVDFIDRYKIGFYLNNILSSFYADAEEGAFEDITDIKWKPFFKEVFGKNNTIEVAIFILLEGVHRINKYTHPEVKDLWDSLTRFALKELESAPETLRSQMMELYVKRIDKMFMNKSYELRVDPLSLSESTYPHLVETISHYAEKIKDIFKRKGEAE